MTPADDVRKLRERLNAIYAHGDILQFSDTVIDSWPAISRALAALEREQDQSDATPATESYGHQREQPADGPASDPSQPAAGIVAEIDDWLEFLGRDGCPMDGTDERELKIVLQRARDEIASQEFFIAHDAAAIAEQEERIVALESQVRDLQSQLAALEDRVPREPTEAMVARAFTSRPDLSSILNNGIVRGLWRSMYDAAREGNRALPIVEPDADK